MTIPTDMALKVDGQWVRISGAFSHGGFNYPENWLAIAKPSDLKRVGAKPVTPADSPPPGHDVVGDQLVDVGGSPKRELITVEIPLATAVERSVARLASDRAAAIKRFRLEDLRVDAAAVLSAVGAELTLRQDLAIAEEAENYFQLADGVHRAWTKAQLVAFGQQANAYLQACQAAEASALAAVHASETAVAALDIPDNVNWPKA